MTPSLVVAVLAACLVLTVWSVGFAVRDRLPGRRFLQSMFVLQGLAVAQVGYLLYLIAAGERPVETTAFAAYAVLSVLLVPGTFVLSLEERTRYGTLVLTAGCVAVAVIETRMVGTWR